MCARHPLETDELLVAIAQDETSNTLTSPADLTEDNVLKYCHNLVVIDTIRKVLIPSHLSVLEYFEEHLWSQSEANCLVASVCLLVLQGTLLYNREDSRGRKRDDRTATTSDKETDSRSDHPTSKNRIESKDPLH